MLVCLQTAFLISSIDISLSKSSSLLFGNCASYCVLSRISPYSELKCSCRSRMDMFWLHKLFGLLSQDLIDFHNCFGCRLAIVSSILPSKTRTTIHYHEGDTPLRTACRPISALRTAYRHVLASRTAYRLITKQPCLAISFT